MSRILCATKGSPKEDLYPPLLYYTGSAPRGFQIIIYVPILCMWWKSNQRR